MDDYIVKTIKAYDDNPQKYVGSTKGLIYSLEIQKYVDLLPDGGSILDVGCGFGKDVKIFSEKGFQVIGIDLSTELLKIAVEFAPLAKFIKMDMRKLEFPDQNFDGVWCKAALLHLNDSDMEIALKEFSRVLKPDGILYLSFKKGVGSKEVVDSFSSDKGRFYNYQTKESLEKMLEKTGFKAFDIYYINERERFGPKYRDQDGLLCFARKLI